MNTKRNIYLFDFDGTITLKDTFVHFIFTTASTRKCILALWIFSFKIVMFVFGFFSAQKLKQQLFSYFFKGVYIEEFNDLCVSYKNKYGNKIIKQSFLKYLESIRKEQPKPEIVIVSASVENWILPFSKEWNVNLIATQIEIENNLITGEFSTPNCKGIEKVKRIKDVYDLKCFSKSFAFGETKGDKEMLQFVNKSYYQYFK